MSSKLSAAKASIPFETCNILVISNYNLIVNVMVVVKSSNNKQWPLDLFIRQAVIASMSLQTWWFGMKI